MIISLTRSACQDRNGELPRNQIGRNGVQVKKENEKITAVCLRSSRNLEGDHCMLLFCRGRQRNVPKFKARAERLFFLIKPIVLQRFHYLSSLTQVGTRRQGHCREMAFMERCPLVEDRV